MSSKYKWLPLKKQPFMFLSINASNGGNDDDNDGEDPDKPQYMK